MRWPTNQDNDPRNIRMYQTVMVPRPSRLFIFTRVPAGSYADVNEVYTCSGYPNTNDPWGSHDISINRVHSHVGTFDRLAAWEHAEWKYVDEKGGNHD